MVTRITSFTHDFRGRRTAADGEMDFYEKLAYDNLDRVVKTERYDTTSAGNLIARRETKFDDRGRLYQRVQHAVDPSTGSVGNALTDDSWYDDAGHLIKQQPAGSRLFTKIVYDGLDRLTKQYEALDVDETSYSDADDVSGDTVLEQTELTYDAAGNGTQITRRHRYHNATGTGELGTPSSTQPKARVTFSATWHDAIGRVVATANYGTNGGSTLSRPNTIPTRSDDVLVSSMTHNSAGNVDSQTNPGGVKTCLEYDAAGRRLKQILNCLDSSSSSSSSSSGPPETDDVNVTVETAYNADGNVKSITAKNAVTGDQTTQYVYGTTLSDSDIASSLLKRKEIYPDSADANDVILFAYNRQGQVKQTTDQNGTVHALELDKLGRQTHDRVTTLGTGVDGAVRRISTTYEVRGMRDKITSYNSETVGSGSVVNETQFEYNDFAQVSKDYQAHGGVVNTSTTPKVQYAYADGSNNTIRPTTLTYPDGRILSYDYGSSDSIPDAASRVAAIVDDDAGSTHLADYSYLGLGAVRGALPTVDSPYALGTVEVDYTEPDIKYTMVGTAGGNDQDTGDIYRGFDRFGRIKDSYWYDYGSSADVDRIKYGHDRNGKRLWRENTVAAASGGSYDELYGYDLIERLKETARGDLSSLKDAITNKQFAQDWALDATSNWRGFREDDDGDGTWDLDQQRTPNKVNEVTDISESAGPSWVTPAYSKAGNITTIPKPTNPTVAVSATYDAWNRLVRVEEGSNKVAEYEYEGTMRRSLKKVYVSGALDETRHFYYTEPGRWQVIEERVDSSSAPDRQFVWGLRYVDDLLLRDRDTSNPKNGVLDERLYGLQDANWNVTAIAATDGSIQERYAYCAYGMQLVLTSTFTSRAASNYGWEVLFAGYRWDSEVALFQVRNRVYLYHLGCWGQRDPLGLNAGINLYEYAGSSPVTVTDPSGQALPAIVLAALVVLLKLCGFGIITFEIIELLTLLFEGGADESIIARQACTLLTGCIMGICVGLSVLDIVRGGAMILTSQCLKIAFGSILIGGIGLPYCYLQVWDFYCDLCKNWGGTTAACP